MRPGRVTRVLVVSDQTAATPALVAALQRRREHDDVQFRLLIPNPARAEVHLLHPERHDKAAAAEEVLHKALPDFEMAAAGPVIASVSIRHDPYEAIEELMASEPVDEIMVSMSSRDRHSWLHPDLSHRLLRLGRPVTVVPNEAAAAHEA